MGRPRQFTDRQLRALVGEGYNQEEIAEYFGVSAAAVSLRIRELREAGHLQRPKAMPPPIMSMAETRAVVHDNYHRLAALLDDGSLSTMERVRVSREMREQLNFGIQITEKLYDAELMIALVDDIHNIMEEVDPKISEEFTRRFTAKRRPPLLSAQSEN